MNGVDKNGLLKAPESWAEAQRTNVNGHAVTSALEVAGDNVQFPSTGAAVRAVPAKGNRTAATGKLIVGGGPRTASSLPGDTFWKGASGRKPVRPLDEKPAGINKELGRESAEKVSAALANAAKAAQRAASAAAEAAAEVHGGNPIPVEEYYEDAGVKYYEDAGFKSIAEKVAEPPTIATPPDIIVHCRDGDKTTTLTVTWEMSWSDVLDMLMTEFGRAVVFQYVNSQYRSVMCDDENAFDIFCSDAEEYVGQQATVDIVNATFKVSDYIRNAPKTLPFASKDNFDNRAESEGIILSRKANRGAEHGDDQAVMTDEKKGEKKRKKRGFLEKLMMDAPYPWTHMLCLGANGLMMSGGAIVVGFWLNWNTLFAMTVALPFQMFLLSFFVSEVEDGPSQLVRLGLGWCGFYLAICVICCYSITREFVGLIAAFLFLLASFWYVELCVKARGWTSWFEGIINFIAWIRGGCPLTGIRKPEPIETITVIAIGPKHNNSDPPVFAHPKAPVFSTALGSTQEDKTCYWKDNNGNTRQMNYNVVSYDRYPNVEWREPVEGLKVRHIGQCLQVLSEKGNPMGPWQEGIINKSFARQLRKWLTRLGKKTDADFKKWKSLPVGEIDFIGDMGNGLVCRVQWGEKNEMGEYTFPATYNQLGENDYWELVECQEWEQGPGEGEFDDFQIMHTGGSPLLKLQTFALYFLPRFCGWLWYWIIFFSYFAMLYIFQFSLTTYSVYQANTGTYPAPGKLYNAQPGNSYRLHIFCKGPKPPKLWDGRRPPVIIEAMEGLGQGVYLSRIQKLISEDGVCCVYDRMGFGSSSADEAGDVWADRSPERIARELHYALMYGVDSTYLQNPVSFEKPYISSRGENLTEYVRVSPPYVFLAQSAGALYARKFAHLFPELVAGMVLVDPLPAEKLDGSYILSTQQRILSPFLMQLGLRFLQPIGLIYNFYPILASAIFSTPAVQFEMNGGYAKNSNDYQVLMSRIFERQWCPTVLAEFEFLYTKEIRGKLGIETVAEGDQKGYKFPTVIWVRNVNLLENFPSDLPTYYDPALSSLAITKDSNNTAARRVQRRDSEKDGDAGSDETKPVNTRCPKCNVSWDDLMRRFLKFFPKVLVSPWNNRRDIMSGDFESCAVNVCDENTIVVNDKEIFEATIRVWDELGYRTEVTSPTWRMQLYGRAQDFDEKVFQKTLADLLRHVKESDVIVTPPTQWQMPLLNTNEEQKPKDCEPPKCFPGYSGSDFGTPRYMPKPNLGYYYVSFVIKSYSARSIEWAQNNLRATEDTKLDKTAKQRRSAFMHLWRLMSVAEEKCELKTSVPANASSEDQSLKVCNTTSIDIFSTAYSQPVYYCPQNTYASGAGCQSCAAEKTSATSSTSIDQCVTCRPEYDKEKQSWIYSYLKCDGRGCGLCPPGTISNAGALGLSDCVMNPEIFIRIKGPSDGGFTSENVTEHRLGRPIHKAFAEARFLELVSLVSGVEQDRVRISPPKDIWNYPRSRCVEMRGGCAYDVVIFFQPKSIQQLQASIGRLNGRECFTYPPTVECPLPDMNETAARGRKLLVTEYEVLQVGEQSIAGRDSGECPDRWIQDSDKPQRTLYDLYGLAGENYECPSKFFMFVQPNRTTCEPCPDMTTSNEGAIGSASCMPLSTLVITAKDASLTYEARTNEAVNGYIDAQPNAITLLNSDDSYLKIRGFALQPDNLISAINPKKGYQIEKCKVGLNCFNETQFRQDFSAMIGSVNGGTIQANEIRLLKPNSCLYVNKDTKYDGMKRDVKRSVENKQFCGPWPGLPPAPGQCVCTSTMRCFKSLGTGMISHFMGGLPGERFEPQQGNIYYIPGFPKVFRDVGTAGQCAEKLMNEAYPLGENAFIYHPSTRLCFPRLIQANELGREICPSQSPECRSQAWFSSDEFEKYSLPSRMSFLTGGETMYVDVPKSMWDVECKVVVEAANCNERLKSPLDTLYFLVNLHAETETDLQAAMQVLRGDINENGAPQRRFKFMDNWRITEIAVADDKNTKELASYSTDGRELNAKERDHFNFSRPMLYQAGAICESMAPGVKRYIPARCGTGPLDGKFVVDSKQPEAICKWPMDQPFTGEKGAPLPLQIYCKDDSQLPICPPDFAPKCMGDRAFDQNVLTSIPMLCYIPTIFEATSPVCNSITMFFQNSKKLEPSDLCVGDFRKAGCFVRPIQFMVTRVNIVLAPDSVLGNVTLSFSDGSDQLITLESTDMWSYYIRPVVTHFVTVRAEPRTDDRFLRIAEVEVFGQNMSEIFDTIHYVDILRPSYTSSSNSPYPCPPTTYAATYERTTDDGQGLSAFKGCSVCPYPQSSVSGSREISNCTCPQCGDSKLSWQGKEQCDDGNSLNFDGCASTCTIEKLQLCEGPRDESGVGLPIRSYSTKDECFRVGSYWTRYGKANWGARFGHGAVWYKDAIWLVGGVASNEQGFYNDAWYEETNGALCVAPEPKWHCSDNNPVSGLQWKLLQPQLANPTWTEEQYTNAGSFQPRGFHGLVSHNGSVWLLGGLGRTLQGQKKCFDDVWKTSIDSIPIDTGGQKGNIVWTKTGSAKSSPLNKYWSNEEGRFQHAVVSFNGSIWVIGGGTVNDAGQQRLFNDLWRTTDDLGALWEEVGMNVECLRAARDTCLPKRRGHAATVSPDGSKIMVFGGLTQQGTATVFLNDVWATSGSCPNVLMCWVRVAEFANWKGRFLHAVTVYQNSLWIVGGQYCALGFTGVTPGELMFRNSSSVLLGGARATNGECGMASSAPTHYGDVWVSVGTEAGANGVVGKVWSECAASDLGERSGAALVRFDTTKAARDDGLDVPNARDVLWVVGGMNGVARALNDTSLAFKF